MSKQPRRVSTVVSRSDLPEEVWEAVAAFAPTRTLAHLGACERALQSVALRCATRRAADVAPGCRLARRGELVEEMVETVPRLLDELCGGARQASTTLEAERSQERQCGERLRAPRVSFLQESLDGSRVSCMFGLLACGRSLSSAVSLRGLLACVFLWSAMTSGTVSLFRGALPFSAFWQARAAPDGQGERGDWRARVRERRPARAGAHRAPPRLRRAFTTPARALFDNKFQKGPCGGKVASSQEILAD